jgi:hypothetical protein
MQATISECVYFNLIIKLIAECIQIDLGKRPNAITLYHCTLRRLQEPMLEKSEIPQLQVDCISSTESRSQYTSHIYKNIVVSSQSRLHIGDSYTYTEISTYSNSCSVTSNVIGGRSVFDNCNHPPMCRLLPVLPTEDDEDEIVDDEQLTVTR